MGSLLKTKDEREKKLALILLEKEQHNRPK